MGKWACPEKSEKHYSIGEDRLGQIGRSQREGKNTRVLARTDLAVGRGQRDVKNTRVSVRSTWADGRGQREVKNTRVLAQTDMGRWGVAREK